METIGSRKQKARKFKGVYPVVCNGKQTYYAATKKYRGVLKQKTFCTEREAALFYDMACIGFGLPPVNILKPKL